ncbi:DUF3311 domain-containing protein [Nocardioides sp. DS6]|uniref:DUF3311 domain-containing protein n=1 Tax=Nocardioides eburneus TaxID=3231482 RepID=A0ABV3SXY5_9ACTN
MPARSTGLWAVVGVLLVLAAVPPLLVPVYAKETPTLWGFPFFFWFQFVLVLWAALMTSGAYFIAKEAFRRDRAARGQRGEGPR